MTMTMTSRTLAGGLSRVKTNQPDRIKRRLRHRGVTYSDVARLAGVTPWMVYAVVNQRKTSRRVMAAIEKLLGGVHATR